jgi:hypothetical protein
VPAGPIWLAGSEDDMRLVRFVRSANSMTRSSGQIEADFHSDFRLVAPKNPYSRPSLMKYDGGELRQRLTGHEPT